MLEVTLTPDAGGTAQTFLGLNGFIVDVDADYGANPAMNYYIEAESNDGAHSTQHLAVTSSNTDGKATLSRPFYVSGRVKFRCTGGTAGVPLKLYVDFVPSNLGG